MALTYPPATVAGVCMAGAVIMLNFKGIWILELSQMDKNQTYTASWRGRIGLTFDWPEEIVPKRSKDG